MKDECRKLGRGLFWILDGVIRARGQVGLHDYSTAGYLLATVARDVEDNMYPLSELEDEERSKIRSMVEKTTVAVDRRDPNASLGLGELQSLLTEITLDAVVRCACGDAVVRCACGK